MHDRYMMKLREFCDRAKFLTENEAVGNSTTETEVLATAPLYDLTTGTHFIVKIGGLLTTGGSHDLDVALRYGTTTIGQIEFNDLGTVGTAVPFEVEFLCRVHTTGSSGKMVCIGFGKCAESSPFDVSSTNTAAAGETVDLSVNDDLNVTFQWSDADASTVATAVAGYVIPFYERVA